MTAVRPPSFPIRTGRSRRLLAGAVAGVLAVALAACSSSGGAATPGGSGDTTIKVGVIAGSPPGLYGAIEKGYLAKQHILVKLVTLGGGPALVAAVAGGSIDIAWADMFAWSAAIERGFGLTVINPANGVKPNQQVNVLVTGKNSKITSAKDLAGKKIGVPAQALTTVQIKRWLANQGLDPNGPKYTVVQDRTTLGGLVAGGQIDAAASSGASVTKWKAQYGLKVAGTYDSGVPAGAATSGYGAKLSWVKSHSSIVQGFVTAVRQGVKAFQASSPKEQNAILVKHGGADVGSLEAKYPGALASAAKAADTELSGPFDVKIENQWLAVGVKYGALTKPIDISKYLWSTATT